MKTKIRYLVFVIFVIIFCIVIIFFIRYKNTSSESIENKYESEISQLHSSVDFDNDGVDDQVDILQGALDYVATNPKYKSKYYAGGYPDDDYGVCTDVVAFALKAAGYDLKTLVDKDIKENIQDYDIETPDSNIDFRRVRNLKVYFEHSAISLTTDIYEIDQWQGGDIVVFESHIGVVSDKRNQNGVTYVIHHNSPLQKIYEEDILENRDDIVGHYRISQ
ncbi:MAG: DUF1287 domain-containing protein [Ruminococcus sp.]|nr:DUF1287 domain-containing protein [Ruminococcus sp.]